MGGSAAAVMQITGVISDGAINVTGSGTLQLAGTASNTYGLTTVTSGTLQLNNSSGFAVPGNAVVNGGTLQLQALNQIPTTSTLTIGGGTFNMGGFNATLDSIIFNSGTLTQGGATLTLSNSGTALNMQGGTSISTGSINLSSNGTVAFSGANELPRSAATSFWGEELRPLILGMDQVRRI